MCGGLSTLALAWCVPKAKKVSGYTSRFALDVVPEEKKERTSEIESEDSGRWLCRYY